MIPGLLGTLSGAFNPLSISGCVLWLDASQIVGLSDGDAVATWSDLSGQGNHATQSDNAKKPTYKVVSGVKSVRFAGAQHMVHGLNSPTPCTAFAVVTRAQDGAAFQSVIMAVEPNASFGLILAAAAFGSANWGEYVDAWKATSYSALNTKSVLSLITNTISPDIVATNGIQESLAFSNRFAGDANNRRYIGADVANNQGHLYGDIFELVVYNSALSAVHRMQVEQYLAGKAVVTLDQSPVNTVAPALSAAGWTVGQVASCDTGTWTNEPTSYAYQWQRKDGGYTDIPGATSSSYLLAAADAGKNVRCGVTPSNAFATGTVAYSLDSDLIL